MGSKSLATPPKLFLELARTDLLALRLESTYKPKSIVVNTRFLRFAASGLESASAHTCLEN